MIVSTRISTTPEFLQIRSDYEIPIEDRRAQMQRLRAVRQPVHKPLRKAKQKYTHQVLITGRAKIKTIRFMNLADHKAANHNAAAQAAA